MKPSERLQANIVTTHLPIYSGGKIGAYQSPHSLTGAQLGESLMIARRFRDRLDLCIKAMSDALDHGETVEEREARIAVEDAYPKAAAQSMGWYAIEDFAAICDQSETGFASRINHFKGKIIKPRDEDRTRLLGNSWKKYPERYEHWADHFEHATDWTEALNKARISRQVELSKKYST